MAEGIRIDPKDMVISLYRASGAGGQKRNKTESAVRIVHLPTGIIVTASESRSQLVNRQTALERLEQRLLALNRRRKKRVATRPTKASRQKRLEKKKQRGQIKAGRAKIE